MYDPKTYWQDRMERQGPNYVGPGGLRLFTEQTAVFSEVLDALLGIFHLPGGADVLDVGCGTGRFHHVLRRNGGCYTGVDINPKAVEYLNLKLIHDMRSVAETLDQALNARPRRFDVGVAVTVLQHVPDEDLNQVLGLLRGCRRVILIEDANPEGATPAAHMNFRTPEFYASRLGMRLADPQPWTINAERDGSHWVAVLEPAVI